MNQHDENPYVGPRAFKKDEADKFYGRDREAQSLLSLVTYERLVLFYAQSGGGKSSLINTQLVPGLEAKGFEVLPVGRVGGAAPPGVEVDNIFVYNLLHSLEQDAEGATASLTPHIMLKDFLQQYGLEDTALEDEEDFEIHDYEVQPRALIIDQFEEILTTNPQHWEKREDFFEQLREAMEDDEYLWVVLSLREDYVSRLDPYAHLLPGRLKARFYMERLDFDGALQAVKGPVEDLRPFAEGVAEELVDNLCLIQDESGTGFVKGQDVQPVQLQVVCYQLWENLKDHPGSEITADDLSRLTGGEDLAYFVDGALQQFYEQALAKITEDVAGQFELRDWFESKLITKAQTRALVHQLSDTTGGLDNAVVKKLEDAYLLRAESRSSGQWYELTHDRMIPPILQANAEWRANHPLIQAALAWKNAGRPEAMLYLGQRLAAACEDPDAEISLVQEFLEAGQEAERKQALAIRAEEEKKRADEQAKAAQRLRSRAWALGIALLLALVTTIWAMDAQNKANHNATEADKARATAEARRIKAKNAEATAIAAQATAEARRIEAEDARNQAEASKLLVQAESSADDEYIKTLLLGLESLKLYDTPQAYSVLPKGMARVPITPSQEHTTDYRLHRMAISPAISPDGAYLAIGDFNGVVTLWEIQGGRLSATPTQRLTVDQPVYGLAFSPDGRTLATSTGNRDQPTEAQHAILFWDITAADPISHTLADQLGSVWRIAFSPDGDSLASAHEDGKVRLWDLPIPPDTPPTVLSGHKDWVWGVDFSPPDGQMLATSGKDGDIALWNLSTSTPTKQILRGHEAWVNDVVFSPDGQRLASASDDGTVILWDVAIGQEAMGFPLTEHTNQVWTVAFSPDGRVLASGSLDHSIIIWNVETQRPTHKLFSRHSGVEDVVFSSDGTGLVSVGGDKIALWDVSPFPPLQLGRFPIAAPDEGSIGEIVLSPDGRTLAALGEDHSLTVCRLITEACHPLAQDLQVSTMAFSADGQTLAFAGHRGDGQIKIIERWDIKSRTSISTPIRLTEPVSHLALSPDGKRLALAGEGTSLTLWDFASAPFSQTLPGHQSNIEHVVFSANDHNILASSAQDGTIILWDLSADSLILQQHTANITDLAFSPDGDVLISAGKDGAVMFWDTKTGVLSRDPLRYTDVVQDLAFSSDGQTLALADSAGILTLWDIAADEVSGYEVRGTFPIGYGGIQALAFSEDTSTLTLLAADTGAVTRWAVDPSEWKETACALAGRNLTWREWNGAFSGDDAVYTKTCEAYPVHPTVVDAKIAEGERDVRQLKIEEARAAFEEANELSETPVWGGEEAMGAEDAIINVLFDVARERFLLGNFEKAGEYLQVIHDLDPTQIPDVEIALEAGRSLEQGRGAIAKAEYDEALSALNRAVELDPQFVVNQQSDLATLYYKVCRGLLDTSVPRARSTCERAVALAGEIEDLMLNLEICQGSEVEALTEVVSPSCHRAVSLADEISFGDAVTRDLEEDSFWTFEGRAGQRFRITMDAMSAGLDPYLRLFRPDGNLMTEDDDGGEGYNARISDLTLPQDGAYIVQAQGLSGSFGRYTLSLAEVSLERIASGEPVTRDLAANIIWTFEGHRGQMFRISMDAVSDDLDPYLRLLGPGGGVDEDHDSGGGRNARMDILLPQNGDYIIQTEGRAGSSGRYVLSLEEASPERITFGDTVVQDLEVESFWAFEGHAGEWVRISMDAVSNGLDPYLHLVGPNKYIIFEDDDGGEGINARIDGFMLPQDGTYAIHAKGEARLFGRYVLSLEEVMPERITVGDAITRDLEAESLWTFAGHAGQIVRITMDAVSPDLDPYLRLLGPGGGQIAEDYDSGGGNNARLDGLILPQDGDYIIHTQGAAGPFGSYRLSLEEVTPERVALGDAVTRDLEEESLWTFAGHAGQIIRITMDAVSPNLDPYLCLLGPGGYQITEDYDGGEGNNARIDGVILPQDGDYIIHAQGAAGPFGRYRLSLEEVTPEPIAYGEPVTRSLEENSLWTFAGHAGQIVRITMDAVSPELDPSLGLLGPDGYQIAWDDNGGGEFNARLDSVILPQDGAYIIHTQGAAGPFGSYRLSLEEVTPERVALGDAVTRDLEEESLWTFAGHAGQIIRITMDAVSPDLDPSLGLLGPDGNQIAWDDDGGGEFNARLDSVILPQDGDYIIHAQDAAEPFGRYRLSLEEVTPEPIAYGEPVTRSLEENSLWTFEGQAGQIIRITMDAVSPDLDRYLHLLRPDGSFVAEDYDSGGALNARLDGFILPQDGAYIIRAQGAAGPFGRYRLSLEDVTPEPIVLGDAVTGSLEEDSLWTFVGHAGQIIRIAMDAASNDLDPSLRLLDPDGNQIAWDGDSGEGNNARIDGVILLQDGAYIIHAQGAAGPFGRYALSLEEITPEPIALGDPVTRDLEENSFWAFEGHAGQMIRITMDAVSDYLDPYLRLLGSDGNQIAWDDNGGGGNNARLDSVILPQDGVYIIHAQGNAGPFGRYKLLLDEVPTETIAFGESVDGDFEDGIAWTFEAQVGHMISVELHKTFSDQEAQLVMVLPDSTHSANRDREADTVTAKLVVPMTGVYRVFPQGEGAYTLSLTAMTATASISHSGVISAMLTDPLGDHWAFSDDGVNAISLTMSSDAFEPYLEFYGPDGMLQQRDTGSGPDGHASLHFVPGTGTYSIVARGAQEEATGPYTLTLTRTAALPQMCGMAWDAIDYGPIAVGSEVILGHHRAVNGDSGWYEMMDPYVGEQAQVTALSGVDGQGCPGVRVDVDNGSGFWRIRDLYLVSP